MRPKSDIVSNNILIQALWEPNGLNALLRGKLPRQTLPAFLHEVTHHWCFQSPIGATIAALRARSDETIWRAKTRDDVTRAAVFRVEAETLGEIYRPLSEGLALFAQHLLRMEPDALAAPPEHWTTSHFLDDPDFLCRVLEMLPDAESLRPEDIPDTPFAEYCARANALFDEARTAESQIDDIRTISMSRLDATGEVICLAFFSSSEPTTALLAPNRILPRRRRFCCGRKSSSFTTPLSVLASGSRCSKVTMLPGCYRDLPNLQGQRSGRRRLTVGHQP
jgi:hypothetical protein